MTAITSAIPAVKPAVTGSGMNWINLPIRAAPNPISITPAIIVATIRPPSPKRCTIGTRMTTKAAVGPDTCIRDPPSAAMMAPATIAVYRPYCGGTPAAMASAIERGRATTPTTIPARRSFRRSFLVYPSSSASRSAEAGRSSISGSRLRACRNREWRGMPCWSGAFMRTETPRPAGCERVDARDGRCAPPGTPRPRSPSPTRRWGAGTARRRRPPQ